MPAKSESTNLPVRLFYSYCHKDQKYRKHMEKSLAILKYQGIIETWVDLNILPGQFISENIIRKLEEADIIVFLVSQNFIASTSCMDEWERAKKLARNTNKYRTRVPIILTDCQWKLMLDNEDLKVLPEDGKPVNKYKQQESAWNDICEGIKLVVNDIRTNFSPNKDFKNRIENTEIYSQNRIKLLDIYEFLNLSCYLPTKKLSRQFIEEKISNEDQLFERGHCLIHGTHMSGKTTLARFLFLSLVKKSEPVLLVDLKGFTGSANLRILQKLYQEEFHGDFSLWLKRENKTIIFDNLTSDKESIDFVEFAKKNFERIVVTTSSDVYRIYYRDDRRLASFKILEINQLTHSQQESLIRKRINMMSQNKPLKDGFVDEVEKKVNSIIFKKIVPRFPFYVLSVIQLFESFTPSNLSISAYGHCYHVFIITSLVKSGIDERDESINTCINFAKQLAFAVYKKKQTCNEKFTKTSFDQFVNEYREDYIISDGILNRMKNEEYGILTADGTFRIPYMYYFFLGMFLCKKDALQKEIIEEICQRSYVSENHLILLFIIHHANDDEVIEDILVRTMCALDIVEPATLIREETKFFSQIIKSMPKNISSNKSVSENRQEIRQRRDEDENQPDDENDESSENQIELLNDLYRVIKNNEILGQVLRNNYGSLKKERIVDIVETVADGGLRLVNIVLKSEKEMKKLAQYIVEANPKYDIESIERMLQFLSFRWTIINLAKIVHAVSHKEIRKIVGDVVLKNDTPAYELIGYFSNLVSSQELTESLSKQLKNLLDKHHRDPFIKGVLSLGTQSYMNTHSSPRKIEQKVYSNLGIKYEYKKIPNLK